MLPFFPLGRSTSVITIVQMTILTSYSEVSSAKTYLEKIKLPSSTSKLGPSVRAGDFGEVLIADYLQWTLGYSVPQVRRNAKIVKDESSKGSDAFGFYFHDETGTPANNSLAVFESKQAFPRGLPLFAGAV